MTTETGASADLLALRELADDIFDAATEPILDAQQVALPYDTKLWVTLSESGLTLLTTPESLGGSGAGIPELAVVLESAGYHGAAVPLAEHDLLAAWLLRMSGQEIPQGPMVAAAAPDNGDGPPTVNGLSWADVAETLVLLGDGLVTAVPREQWTIIDETHDITGQTRATVRIETTLDTGHPVTDDVSGEFRLRGALGIVLQTCGALARALDLSREHVQKREQFGRPIAKFQAVQSLLSSAAGALAMAKTAAAFATEVTAEQGFSTTAGQFAIAVAKIESARAATVVARNAHQAHGAIGFTLDHRLRHFTNRALAWRSEFGSQRYWQEYLGRLAIESTGTAWDLVTALSSASSQHDSG
ncbi:acyl-CoA dehydrogenase family protein [Mycobacterium sp. M26]|uniref:acyl-CoA dehydrogenase family protein n=1 Tax=Mycobacterium sp. M26 TaxID=1762962 RepID=UPI00073F9A52|nr:acyl-CoA dehydrogenase family protein [Mycobacterium sp. M26]